MNIIPPLGAHTMDFKGDVPTQEELDRDFTLPVPRACSFNESMLNWQSLAERGPKWSLADYRLIKFTLKCAFYNRMIDNHIPISTNMLNDELGARNRLSFSSCIYPTFQGLKSRSRCSMYDLRWYVPLFWDKVPGDITSIVTRLMGDLHVELTTKVNENLILMKNELLEDRKLDEKLGLRPTPNLSPSWAELTSAQM